MSTLGEHVSLRPEFLEWAERVDAPTPSLIVDEVTVRHNVARVVALVGAAHRWRPHVKTLKSQWLIGLLREAGVTRVKASTCVEVAVALDAGITDVLLAVPPTSTALRGVRRLREEHPQARVSILLDSPSALERWGDGSLDFFLDLDSGGHRTGLDIADPRVGAELVQDAVSLGHVVRGLHHYDGHLAGLAAAERDARTHEGLDRLAAYAVALHDLGIDVAEIVTGGSHTFLPALEHDFPEVVRDVLTMSPGTVTLCDARSLERLGDVGLRPAAAVLCEVLSNPGAGRATVDAGLTVVQVDAGTPHAVVAGRPWIEVGEPAQEHLSLTVLSGVAPVLGERLVLIPRHVDTAMAQFDAVVVPDGADGWNHTRVDARHHSTWLSSLE